MPWEFIESDPGAELQEPADPGMELRSIAPNTEAPDDGTGLGSEFQLHRRAAQLRVPEGLDGR
jgi:hypothetical protein